jgi:hypothetical protein
MANCIVCERDDLDTDAARERRICEACATSLGVVAMPKAHRPPLPCQRCQHLSFVRVIPRELTVKSNTYASGPNEPWHGPMCATYEVRTVERLIRDGRAVEQVRAQDGRGTLEMYICRHCGFVEWYCMQPADLPIGPQYMTEIVEYESQERPYR